MSNREQNQRVNDALQSGETDRAPGEDERDFGAGGQPNDNLERNPGIGQSKGAFATGEEPRSIEGDNTLEGDVDNDPGRPGDSVDPERTGRENK